MTGLDLAIGVLLLMKRTRCGCACSCGCNVWLDMAKGHGKHFASPACWRRFLSEMRALKAGATR